MANEITEAAGNIRAELNASIGSTDTSLTLTKEFTSKTVPVPFFLAIGDDANFRDSTVEFVKYTSFTRNGDGTSTFGGLTRGIDNTTASSWSDGVTVAVNAPGDLWENLPQQDEPFDLGSNPLLGLLAIVNAAQSSEYSDPSNGDAYIDDGTNTVSGNAAFRMYVAGAWEDLALVSELFSGSHNDLSDVAKGDHRTDEQIQDLVNTMISMGDKLSKNYDDAGNTLTLNTSALDQEEVDDFVAGMLIAGNAITLTRDDPNNELTIAVDESGIALANLGTKNHGDLDNISSDDHHNKTVDTRTDISEGGTGVLTDVQDINFAGNLTVTDDGDGTVTIEATDTRTDVAEDGSKVVNDVTEINFGTNVTVTDDGDGTVTITTSDTDTDTRTDVSEDGTAVVTEVTDINFSNAVTVTDDGDGSVTVGVDESGIALANLGTKNHSDLDNVGATDHHDPANQDVESVDGYDVAVVDSLPGTPDSSTLYFVRE